MLAEFARKKANIHNEYTPVCVHVLCYLTDDSDAMQRHTRTQQRTGGRSANYAHNVLRIIMRGNLRRELQGIGNTMGTSA